MKRLVVGAVTVVVTAWAILKRTKPEQETVKKPKFKVGDQIVTLSPFTNDYVYTDFDGTPLYYTIDKVRWFPEDDSYRYWLEIEGEWIAESWLQKPEHPQMTSTDDDDEDYSMVEFIDGDDDDDYDTGQYKEVPVMKGPKGLEKSELARRKSWAQRADELLDEYNNHLKAGDKESADEVMQTYQQEQAMFNAGSLIREIGGELGGIEPKLKEEGA